MGLCSFLCCSKCCGLLSIFGIFFLFSVGHMFSSQPMFTNVEVWEEEHGEGHEASKNCYIGGAIYCATLGLSILCFVYDKKRVKRRPAIADVGASNLQEEALSVHPVTLAI